MYFEYGIFYLIFISALSVITCVLDKLMAKRGGRRVPEKTLFILSILGGSLAMYLTMRSIRHKTKHKRFMIGIPLIFIFQLTAVIYIYSFLNSH